MRFQNLLYTVWKSLKQNAEPASVAQLDARLTGDQGVAGSTLRRVSNILS